MLRKIWFLLFMLGSVVVPYVATSSSDLWKTVSGLWSGSSTGSGSAPGPPASSSFATVDQSRAKKFGETPVSSNAIEGAATTDLGEVIQFDGSPAWVMSRWPRVSAGLAQLDLQGYRVPLVTGTGVDDLAGSLTYYFDKEERVGFITFHGSTGDPSKLIALVTSRYSFQKQTTNDPSLGLYQAKQWNGKPLSELRIRPARVVRADQPRSRFEVDLAMRRP